MRLVALTAPFALAILACGPPRASQFVGQDGSRDWWRISCRGDEAACWQQAKDACHDNFNVHELRTDNGAPQPLALTVKEGAVPIGTAIAGKVLVLSCSAPTVAPRFVAGPECATSRPVPNHCDDATGETFTTGRTYLPLLADAPLVARAEARSSEKALMELTAVAGGLDAEIDAIAKPIAATTALVKAIGDLPRTYRMKPARMKAMARAVLLTGNEAVPSDVRAEAFDDVKELLARIKATRDALNATPDEVAALLEKVKARKAKAALIDDAQVKADALQKLAGIEADVAPLSNQAGLALARLTEATR